MMYLKNSSSQSKYLRLQRWAKKGLTTRTNSANSSINYAYALKKAPKLRLMALEIY